MIDNNYLERYVPSVFAHAGHERTSERYKCIPTIDVIEEMKSNGFIPVSAIQTRSQKDTRRLFAKHMITFQHKDSTESMLKCYPRINLINSHDGTSAYKLITGLLRLI